MVWGKGTPLLLVVEKTKEKALLLNFVFLNLTYFYNMLKKINKFNIFIVCVKKIVYYCICKEMII